MDFVLIFLLILGLVFVLIVVHESGHYLAGVVSGIPARDMRLVLLAFPQHVAVRDGDEWVSPVKDIHRYIEVTRRHLGSPAAAFRWVAGGMALESAFTVALWGAAMGAGYRGLAFWTVSVSLAMYAVNVGLMDVPWALRHRCAAGDTSGLWQIAPVPTMIFSVLMVIGRVSLILLSAEPGAAPAAGVRRAVPMILRILAAEVRGPHRLWLSFSDGTQAEVDVRPLLTGPVFEPLRDPAYFAGVNLDSVCGTVVWPNGADFAPEALHTLASAGAVVA